MPVRLLKRFPVLKTVSAYLVINAVADFNEQVLIKKRTRETYKYDKTARITFVGAFVVSPIVFAWMRFAEKLLPGRGLRVVMAKVVLDQLFAAPVEISTFYICTNILEGKTDVFQELKEKFWKTWTTGLFFWPAAQCINFSVIPPAYRTSRFMPLCSLTWTTYLCYMKELRIQKEADSSADEQCLSVNFPEEDIRLSPEISEGFLSSNLQFHPMPVSLETRARSGPMRRPVFSEMTVNADMREQETSLDDTYRELCADVQYDEFQRALSTNDNDTCDTFARTCSFGKTNYSGQCVVKMTGNGHPQTMVATHAENNRHDNLYNLDESSSKQTSQVEQYSCTCNRDKLLVNDNTDKDSLNSDCDENSGYTHGHNLSRHIGRVTCDLPQRCTADALLAQFLT